MTETYKADTQINGIPFSINGYSESVGAAVANPTPLESLNPIALHTAWLTIDMGAVWLPTDRANWKAYHYMLANFVLMGYGIAMFAPILEKLNSSLTVNMDTWDGGMKAAMWVQHTGADIAAEAQDVAKAAKSAAVKGLAGASDLLYNWEIAALFILVYLILTNTGGGEK